MAPVSGWDRSSMKVKMSSSKLMDRLKARKMGRCKDLSNFYRDQIVMASWLGQSISKSAALPVLLWSYLPKVVQGRKSSEPAPGSWVAKAHRSTWGAHVGWPMWSDATDKLLLLKLLKKFMLVLIEKMSEHTMHHTLLCMGLRSCRPVRVPMLTPAHCRKSLQWAPEHSNGTTEQWKKVAGLMNHVLDVLDKEVRSMDAPPHTVQD